MNVKVVFAEERLRQTFGKLKESKTEDKKLYEWLNRAFDDLKNNPFCGIQIQRRLIPREYIRKYNIDNLWKYNLPNAWRLIYSVVKREVVIISVIIEWMDHKNYERRFGYGYCRVLGILDDGDAIDLLFDTHMLKWKWYHGFMSAPMKSLIRFDDPRFPTKAMELVKDRYEWCSRTASYDEANCYLDLCRALIQYRSMDSVPILSRVIEESIHDIDGGSCHINLCSELLECLVSETKETEIIQDPFVLGFKSSIERVLSCPEWYVRLKAVKLLTRMPLTEESAQRIVAMGTGDKDHSVREAVAEWLAQQKHADDGSVGGEANKNIDGDKK